VAVFIGAFWVVFCAFAADKLKIVASIDLINVLKPRAGEREETRSPSADLGGICRGARDGRQTVGVEDRTRSRGKALAAGRD